MLAEQVNGRLVAIRSALATKLWPVLACGRGGGGGRLHCRVLGPVEASGGGRNFLLGGPGQRALLADLIVNTGSAASTGWLIDNLRGMPHHRLPVVRSRPTSPDSGVFSGTVPRLVSC